MALRTVGVRLQAEVSNYIRNIKQAGKDTKDLTGELDDAAKAGDRTAKAADHAGDKLQDLARDARRLDADIAKSAEGMRDLARDIAHASDEAERAKLSEKLRVERVKNRDLVDLRKLIDFDSAGALGGELAEKASLSFVQRFGPLMAQAPLGPAGAVAGGLLAAGLAPTLAAAASGAIVGGVGVGGVIGGVVLAARDQRVKAAGADLGEFILGDLEARAAGFVPVVLDGIDDVRAGWTKLGPDLDRIFASSRFVDPLVDGAVSGGRKLIRGLADAVDKADPVVDAFGRSFDAIGESAGNFFTTLSGDAKEGASALDDVTNSMTNLMDTGTQIVHYGAQIKGGADKLDMWIDKGRFWIEDNSALAKGLHNVGIELDLTADGFKKGSEQAEAARRASQGLATVTDFATLKLAGMTDAQIAATDASGTYRNKLGEVNSAAGITQTRFYEGNAAMVIFNSSMAEGIEKTGSLSAAFQAINGHALASRDAESNYQAAIDAVSESIKKNGKALNKNGTDFDLHTEKGRANDKAIRNLVGTINANAQAAYDAKAATGDLAGAEADAKEVYEGGRQQLIKNLTQILGNKDAAIALAGKIMAIPKSWGTDVDVKDKATAKVAAIKHEISTIHGKTVTIAVKYETHGSAQGEHIIGQGTQMKNRWGGVYEHAQDGLLRDAAIYSPDGPARYAFAEPATGGELFAPKNGDLTRTRAMVGYAIENWWGGWGNFGPRAGGGGPTPMPVGGGGLNVENLNVRAYSDRFSLGQVMNELAMQGVH